MARYWCKVCSLFVEDTKLGRKLHEKTVRHKKGVQDQLRVLHDENKRQDIAYKNEQRALRVIEKSLDSSSRTFGDQSTVSASIEKTQSKLTNRIAKVDSSKTIDPTPLERKKRPQIQKEHEFDKFSIEQKKFEGHEVIALLNDNVKLGSGPIIKQKTTKPLFKKRKINEK